MDVNIIGNNYRPPNPPYIAQANLAYPIWPWKQAAAKGNLTVGRDYVVPFYVRDTVTFRAYWLFHEDATPVNVAVGLYNQAGVLLSKADYTQSAAGAAAGAMNANAVLVPRQRYFMAVNEDAQCLSCDEYASTSPGYDDYFSTMGMYAAQPGTPFPRLFWKQTRATATMPATMDLTNVAFTSNNYAPVMGFML